MSNIKAVIPLAYRDLAEDAEISENLIAVQKYLDSTKLDLDDATMCFVPVKGVYTHISRKMLVTALLVNKTGAVVIEVKSMINLTVDDDYAEIAEITMELPVEFMGELKNDEALLMSMTVPVRNLYHDRVFEAYQFTATMDNTFVHQLT
jgi:hypothetical protein